MKELSEFIQSNPDVRELKRGLAVQMVYQEHPYVEIAQLLQVSIGYISKWKQIYEAQGVEGLRLRYRGSVGYLNAQQRQSVVDWLKQQNHWNLEELQHYIEEHYGVIFASKQSYYALFAAAGISWKKTQKRNPKADPVMVAQKNKKSALGSKNTDMRLRQAS